MNITITYYGVEHTINTKPEVDYMDSEVLDDTTLPEVARALKSLLLSLTFDEELINETFLNVENDFDDFDYFEDEEEDEEDDGE
jgi:hypothetical protein